MGKEQIKISEAKTASSTPSTSNVFYEQVDASPWAKTPIIVMDILLHSNACLNPKEYNNMCKHLLSELIKNVNEDSEPFTTELDKYFINSSEIFVKITGICKNTLKEMKHRGKGTLIKDYPEVIKKIVENVPFHIVLNKVLERIINNFGNQPKVEYETVFVDAFLASSKILKLQLS